VKSFFFALRESRPPVVTVRDGARATIGCLRMLESARDLTPCTIDLEKEFAVRSQSNAAL
jgi:hypothetical protein